MLKTDRAELVALLQEEQPLLRSNLIMPNKISLLHTGCFTLRLLIIAILFSTLTGCGNNNLGKIKERGTIIILTTNRATTYYYDRDNKPAGPEYEMTQAFGRYLGVHVKYKIFNATEDLITALRNNEGDLAAASLTMTPERLAEFEFGPVYQEASEYIVCHRTTPDIETEADLKNIHITVGAGTSYIETLQQYPEISWDMSSEFDTASLLAQVAEKKQECTVSDSTLYSIERRYYTSLQNKYTLATNSKLAWMTTKGNGDVRRAMTKWLELYKQKGHLAALINKYYGFVEIFDYVDIHKFLRRIQTRLPRYRDMFIDAAKKNQISATTLAAQSYQESHWNRRAKSPTGVRGLMMLTQPVAKSLGVTNRLHARQNIYAGAKFYARMKTMVGPVNEPDRTWLALAAYNIGIGHFRDAQSLAKKLGKDPNRWYEMKEILPLLAQEKFHKDLRYGYARGNEPVRYVMRIRSYEELLRDTLIVSKP